MATTLADLFAALAKPSAVVAKPARVFAENAKVVALAEEKLDEPRAPLARVVPACNCCGRHAG